MRTTVRIDDDLFQDLKKQAQRERTSLTQWINRLLRLGMHAMTQKSRSPSRYREKTFAMGEPKVDLDKALALAAAMEDEAIREELARRK